MLVPVTAVIDDGAVRLVKLMCEFQDIRIWRIVSVENDESRLLPFSLDPRNEGIAWIIGHHNKLSNEGKALLVAWALSPLSQQSRDDDE